MIEGIFLKNNIQQVLSAAQIKIKYLKVIVPATIPEMNMLKLQFLGGLLLFYLLGRWSPTEQQIALNFGKNIFIVT